MNQERGRPILFTFVEIGEFHPIVCKSRENRAIEVHFSDLPAACLLCESGM
jgi:hypothetical protein